MSFQYEKHKKYPDHILVRNFIGKVDVQSIIQSWEYIKAHDLIDLNIKGVINNLSDCELVMDLNSFHQLIRYLKSQKHLRGIKLAVVCNSPQKIVFPTMGEMLEPDLHIHPFSTLEAAEKWIMN